MPSAHKLKDLYLAKSLQELQEKASISSDLTTRSASSLSTVAMKLYKEAQKCLHLDEEKAYILLYRCMNAAEQMRKAPGGKSDKTFDGKTQLTALTNLENLSKSLSERYKVKESSINGLQKIMTLDAEEAPLRSENKGKVIELLPTPQQTPQIQNGNHKSVSGNANGSGDGRIGCIELYDMMHDKMTTLIIFDCRPSEDFAESHISHSSCVNIPEEILKPGMTAASLGAALQGEARSLWNKRALVDFVVLMDNDSSRSNMIPHSALNSLNLAISKWDASCVLKRDPVILENGFQEWLMHYPTTVTKLPVAPPISMNSLEFQNSLPYIDVEYPDLEDLSHIPDSALMNIGFHEKSPSKASQQSVTQNTLPTAFYVEKNVEHTFVDNSINQRLSTTTQVPTVDRKTKPKTTGSVTSKSRELSSEPSPMEEVLAQQQKLADSQVALSEERLRQEQAFQQLRVLRETEANESMLQEVKRREEELLARLQELEDSNRVLQDKWKVSEDEKDALRKKLQVEIEDKKHRDALAEKQDRKKKMDSEVERLRQERKKREKLEKEKEEEQRLASERQRLEDKSSANLSTHLPQMKQPPDASYTPPQRPPNKPAASNQSAAPNVPQIHQQKAQVSPSVYSVRLKDESDAPSPSRGMNRSYSSPNIAQLMAEEDQREAGLRGPPLEKVFRQAKIGDESSPKINRSLKPVDPSSTRMRNFSPVFSSQPNTVCGLKNLGNTCFMNSVLQCLSHTHRLAQYLLNGAYIKDINRSGSFGEVIQELSSVFQNLGQTYRSISPHEFKNTVSRHMSVCEGYDQQDAHEFLVVLMEKLHMETNKGTASKGSNPPDLDKMSATEEALNHFWIWHLKIHNSYIVQSFEGVLQSQLTCSACGHRACTYEVFSCLSLPIPSNTKCSLKDCIQSLLKAEMMRGEAAWKCPICKRKQDAEKKMGLCRLPPILIIHLKRFSYEGLWRRKLVTHVDFPVFDLNMEQYLIVPTKKCKYNLYAVVNHYGTLEGGHYTAYCKNDKWFNFDDHDVQPMSLGGVKTSAAYILFYATSDNHA